MDHPLEAFARDSNFFTHVRLIPVAFYASIAGVIISAAVGVWSGSALLGVGVGLTSAIGGGVLFDACVWRF